nr:MAG: hypothetical protein EDM05_17135 [Leptolyngbya sp. IPPAS B-1204]
MLDVPHGSPTIKVFSHVWGFKLCLLLAELIPLVNNLSQSDKLSLFKLLAAQIPEAELHEQKFN